MFLPKLGLTFISNQGFSGKNMTNTRSYKDPRNMQLELKILWSNNFLGLAIDQVSTKYTLPITSYYFWPKTEAWEQLKIELAFKPWVKDKEKVKILNSAAEVMNFWRANRNTETLENVMAHFSDVHFVKITTQAYSSADRAPDSDSGCRGFDSLLAY